MCLLVHKNYFKDYINLKEIVMTDSITQIKNQAFLNCSQLEHITFSKNLDADNINVSAFSSTKWYKNLELTDYTIINNTLVYVSSLFEGESGVFEIPNTVKYLAGNLFANNQNINKVVINKEIEYINNQAFVGSKISSAVIDENNEFYSIDTYNSKSALYKLNVDNKEKETLIAYFASVNGGVFVVPAGVKKIYDYAFELAYAPEYVFVRDENVDVYFDAYLNTNTYTSYIFENDTITSNENVNCDIVYRLLTQEEGGYSIVYKDEDESVLKMPNFDNVEGLDQYNLVIIPNYDKSMNQGEEPIYLFDCYYLVKILDSDVTIIELEGFCPYVEE